MENLTNTAELPATEAPETAEEPKKLEPLTPEQSKMFEDNAALVVNMISKGYVRVLPRFRDDVISVGNIALMKACKDFDPSLGFKFSTFAWQCVRNAMWQAVKGESRNQHASTDEFAARVSKAEESADLGDDAAYAISGDLNEKADRETVSAEAAEVWKMVDRLEPKQAKAVRLHMESHSFRAIGEEMNCSGQMARNYYTKGMVELKKMVQR